MINFSGGQWELSRGFNLLCVSGQSHFSAAEGALELDFPSSSNHHLPAGVWDPHFFLPGRFCNSNEERLETRVGANLF